MQKELFRQFNEILSLNRLVFQDESHEATPLPEHKQGEMLIFTQEEIDAYNREHPIVDSNVNATRLAAEIRERGAGREIADWIQRQSSLRPEGERDQFEVTAAKQKQRMAIMKAVAARDKEKTEAKAAAQRWQAKSAKYREELVAPKKPNFIDRALAALGNEKAQAGIAAYAAYQAELAQRKGTTAMASNIEQ